MTLPPKTITVQCPQCQQTYIAWYIPTLAPALGSSSAEGELSQPGPQQPSTVCSRCGYRSLLSEEVNSQTHLS